MAKSKSEDPRAGHDSPEESFQLLWVRVMTMRTHDVASLMAPVEKAQLQVCKRLSPIEREM